ncbi:MAG TPA: tripartite tricarboxylate transporter substrate binding protein [Burkholderiales bacterium]|nr:tripartite tricarboxylate transporter substrate binding protein [Burkholderiales bacterium]
MNQSRLPHVLCMIAMAAALPAFAQTYPAKPIRIVVPFPPGGTSDILARAIGQKLTEAWKQQVIVDDRPGAGANIGAEIVAKAPSDGYTLFILSTIHTINPSLYSKLAYDPVKDFSPITLIADTSQVLVVHPSLPVRTVKEFIAYAKKHPGALNYSSAGNGSQPHLTAELFKAKTGIDLVHVPYKGAPPAMTDLLAGQVALTFATAPSAVPFVKNGKLHALGVSTAQRIAALPDVPTIAEAGVPGFEAAGWNGLVGPAGMPAAVVDHVHAAVVKIVHVPAMASFLSGQGADPHTTTPSEFGVYIKSEVVKWAQVVKDSGARID